MTLFYRLKRLVRSDVHAVLDSLEEPKLILLQSLRDMKEELERIENNCRETKKELQDKKSSLEDLSQTLKELDDKIALAISEKKEEAARFFIKKQILSQKNKAGLEKAIQKITTHLQELEKDLANKQELYDDIAQKSETLITQMANQSDAFESAKKMQITETELDHEVELELLKRMKGDAA